MTNKFQHAKIYRYDETTYNFNLPFTQEFYMKKFFLISLLVSLASCAHWYSQDQKTLNVVVVNHENQSNKLPTNCINLHNVEGVSYWDRDLAMIHLRQAASAISATHVVLTKSDFGFWKQAYFGEAYKCQ
jgi:hypothetical protein